MATLTDTGAHIGAAARPGRGALLLAGRLVAARPAIKSAALRLAVAGRGVALSAKIGAAVLSFAAVLRPVGVGPGHAARRVVIVKPLARVSLSGAKKGAGPGVSVGEVVQALPAALAGWPLPEGYIGRRLAALAVARGEVVQVEGNSLTVGGRVVLEPSGEAVFVATGGAVKAARALALEAGHIGEGVALAAGAVRDAWLSEQRAAAASFVRKNAKAAAKVGDAGKRAALLADLKYMELRA